MSTTYPLSTNQNDIYIDCSAWTAGVNYHIGATIAIVGRFDIEHFEACFNWFLRQTPALRTRLIEIAGKPYQVVVDYREEEIKVIDFSEGEEGEEAAQRYIQNCFCQPFHFGREYPLIEFKLLRIGGNKHLFYTKFHHLITDGWGTSILFREVIRHYNRGQGAVCTLEPNFALAALLEDEAKYLNSKNFDKDRIYWQQRLSGFQPRLFSRISQIGRQQQVGRGKRQAIYLSRETYDRAAHLCQSSGSNVFHLILSLLILYFGKREQQSDVTVGLSLLNRSKKGFKQAVGLFVSTAPFRLEVKGSETLREILAEIRFLTRQDYRHQRFPVREIKRAARMQPGDLLYDIYLSYEKHDYSLKFKGSTHTACIPLYSGRQQLPLVVYVREFESDRDVKIDFDYNLAYFSPEAIEQITTHFQRLFAVASQNLDLGVGELMRLALGGGRHFLSRPTQAVKIAATETIVSRFASVVERHSEAIAVQFRNAALTYKELDARANRLAHYLQQQGVGIGDRVGLCLERSEKMVVAILGVLKAGAAYVPLDPLIKSARLTFILEDSGISLLVVEGEIQTRTSATPTATITLEAIESQLGEYPSQPPKVALIPQLPAYVIYTSGSTGTPKGCVVTHGNVVRLFDATEAWFSFNEDDVWTVFHSFAFDFSVWEMWGALLYGGKAIIVPFWMSRSPEVFRDFLTSAKVTVLNQTPSAFRQLLQADESNGGEFSALRYIIFGGEALNLPSLRPWFERHGDRRPQLVNMYGITETTVHVTYRPLSWQDIDLAAVSPIGVPIPDLDLYLLDENLEPVPEGLSGEICIGGGGVSLGYLNRPVSVAQRFVPNPFGAGRLYRSGDLGRWLPDGELEYLGRLDRQVKIRGFRIELGEVQGKLEEYALVREAIATVVRRGEEEEPCLVAYYVPVVDAAPTADELREYLQEQLPEYMVPAAYVRLDALPLTGNGKLDFDALPAPDWNQSAYREEYTAPRNRAEATLCSIIGEVLGLDRVGIDDNFFELGGDSMIAMQVAAKAGAARIPLSLKALYEGPTVRQLAAGVDGVIPKESDIETPTQVAAGISPADRERLSASAEDAYPLSSSQAGILYHGELHPDSAIFRQIFSFRLRLPYVEEAWEKALGDLMQVYPILRTSFHWAGYSEPLQIVQREVSPEVSLSDWRTLDDAFGQVREAIETEKRRGFDVTRAPLHRLLVQRLSDTEVQLSFSFHHVILDGWSAATAIASLLQRYLEYVENRPTPLSVPTTSYGHYVALERQAVANCQTRDFWQTYLSGLELTRLPRLPRIEAAATRTVERLSMPIESASSAKLQAIAREVGVSLKSVCLAIHLRVLSFLTGRSRVVTGNILNARSEIPDGGELLGLFINAVPFVFTLRPTPWLDLVRAVHQGESQLLAHRYFPLLEIQRLVDRRPLFEVGFNFVHFHVYEGILALEPVAVLDVEIVQETDFPLLVEFCLVPGSNTLQINFEYDTTEFSAAQVAHWGEYYREAIAALTDDPTANFATRSLMSPPEKQQWFEAANARNSSRERHIGKTLGSYFAKAVERYAERIAVSFEQTHLTYAELEMRANQLARCLQRRGIGAESFVGICLERTEELVVAILATLKAGGAYVPIDPNYKSDRLNFLLEDSGISLLIAQRASLASLPGGQFPLLVLEDAEAEIDAQSVAAIRCEISPDNAAYVIYTSGSTGTPKGCVVTHANVIRLFESAASWFEFSDTDVWTMFHSYAFDFSVWEMWGALLNGGRVSVVPYWTARSPRECLNLLQSQGITVFNQTPSAFKALLAEIQQQGMPELALRYIIFGGEALELPSLQPWFASYPDSQTQLVNMYGITETTVHVTYKAIQAADLNVKGGSAIGQPLPDLSLYLLDEDLEPVPVGAVGEIYVGGAGVVRGYLNRPGLSGDRFRPDPFAKIGGSRLYRSGDLARRLSNGELEYLGRRDRQVKIRGFRLEPGEIEVALTRHHEVKQAYVRAWMVSEQQARLIAYVVGDRGEELETPLREWLATQLPEYALPSGWVWLDRFPLTAHGKVDTDALPIPDWTPNPQTYVAPRNDREVAICALMASVLGVDRVGTTDDFFELGGHSLLATQLVVRLRECFKSDLPLQQLFKHRTPEQIARLVGNGNPHPSDSIPRAKRVKRRVQLSHDGQPIAFGEIDPS